MARIVVIVASLLLGLWSVGEGSYIHAKARLAQLLIDEAWQETLKNLKRTKPWSWADTWPVARLTVPGQNVDLYVLAGDSGRTLAFGPGHRFGSALPGEAGTSLISAHRDTHFGFLKNLQTGSEIFLQNAHGTWHRYVVDGHAIVHESAAITNTSDTHSLVLVTCYPFDTLLPGGALRYAVYATEQETAMTSLINI